MSNDQEKFKNKAQAGAFVRRAARFSSWISTEPGAEFPAEAGRYRLYASVACPWAHRCTMMRVLKGLEDVVSLTWTSYVLQGLYAQPPFDDYKGWLMDPKTEPHGFSMTRELYEHAQPGYSASWEGTKPVFSVPVLFDEKTQKIVSNESGDIIMMFNSAFNAFAKNPQDFYPEALRAEIDEVHSWVYPGINDGVYRCGFAKTQAAYDDAVNAHNDAMDKAEALLEGKKYLVGDAMTVADVRLFTTLLRYDCVYYSHFKCGRSHLSDMPNLLRFTRQIVEVPGMKDTIDLGGITRHYYECQTGLNPFGIVPRLPKRARGFEDLLENSFGVDDKRSRSTA